MSTTTLPTLKQIQDALAELTNWADPEKFQPNFRLLNCANEIEALERRFNVRITVHNFVRTTVSEVMAGMSAVSDPLTDVPSDSVAEAV